MIENTYTATYSPEDNKLRLFAENRLDESLYNQARALGFRWAPKQKLFVAPKWTPNRSNFLLELCGFIDDEQTTLAERAETRAARFDIYSDKRAEDAKSKAAEVQEMGGSAAGESVVIGHHNANKAEKQAEKIKSSMKKAVDLWATSKYWTSRAQGVISSANYKDKPDVRARRIKGIIRDKNRATKTIKEFETKIKLWNLPDLTTDQAIQIAKYKDWSGKVCFEKVLQYPEDLLKSGQMTAEEVKQQRIESLERTIEWRREWIAHYENRIMYEQALLDAVGWTPPKRPKQKPLLNYPGTITLAGRHGNAPETFEAWEMTKAEYKAIWHEHKCGNLVADGSHRVKVALYRADGEPLYGGCYRPVFLTDSKQHKRPDPVKEAQQRLVIPDATPAVNGPSRLYADTIKSPEDDLFKGLSDSLKNGVSVVVAPQLFPTPPELVEKMISYADIYAGQRILEPSAGTGNIVKALPNIRPGGSLMTVEINQNLSNDLSSWADHCICADFLECDDLGEFDRIIMNPPFERGADIKHIHHAFDRLLPGGRLVALCANGPRQRKAFMDEAEHWEDLPEGSFKAQGTNVNVALLVLTN